MESSRKKKRKQLEQSGRKKKSEAIAAKVDATRVEYNDAIKGKEMGPKSDIKGSKNKKEAYIRLILDKRLKKGLKKHKK